MTIAHRVSQGECVNSIAHNHGLRWRTVWNHPSNAPLRRHRSDPNILLPGDVVHVPERAQRRESGATDSQHQFVVKASPVVLRLRLTCDRRDERERSAAAEFFDGVYREPEEKPAEVEPNTDTPYALYVDGSLIADGRTDADGRLEQTISPAARRGTLVLNPGTPGERKIELNLGHMDPVEEWVGVSKRLFNLGYPCPAHDEPSAALAAALRAFQRDQGLEPSGEADAPTRQRLRDAHGG